MKNPPITKFLFFTDSQIKVKHNQRTDENFLNTVLSKIEYIQNFSSDTDYILCGGDLGDYPVWSKSAEIGFIKLFKHTTPKFVTTVGNHDVQGKNIDNYATSSLAMLEAAKIIDCVYKKKIFYAGRIRIKGFEYGSKDYLTNNEEIDIALIHDTVSKGKSPYWENIEEIDIPKCKLALFGDVHCGFDAIKLPSGCIAANPGSLSRMSRTETHKPTFLEILWNQDTGKFELFQHVIPHVDNPFKDVEDNTEKLHDLANKFRDVKEMFKQRTPETPEEKIDKVGRKFNFSDDVIKLTTEKVKDVK